MRIIMFPTWYPTVKDPLLGSFFREQANVMGDIGIEYVVVMPVISYLGIRGFIKYFFNFLKGISFILDIDILQQNPTAYTFKIPQNYYLGKTINSKIKDILFKIVIMNISKKWNPSLVHGISFPEGAIYAHESSRILNIPYVLVEHNVFVLHFMDSNNREKVLSAYANANNVGAVSEYQKRAILINQPQCNPKTLWNLVDENKFKIRKIIPKIFTIITVTYSSPIKDYITFLDSMKILLNYNIDFRFIMVGRDSWSNDKEDSASSFIEYSKELNIIDLGKFIPHVTREDMSMILAEASVFVVTSIAETYGVAAREAMMCGIPVVTTACGGVEDAINSTTGLVAKIRDPSDIAKAIFKIHESIDSYEPEVIRSYSINNFGRNKFIDNMKKFYHEALV